MGYHNLNPLQKRLVDAEISRRLHGEHDVKRTKPTSAISAQAIDIYVENPGSVPKSVSAVELLRDRLADPENLKFLEAAFERKSRHRRCSSVDAFMSMN